MLVNACIHPGECEGKDAGLALLRDLLINGQYKTNGLLDHAILVFVPIHGVDGHERFGPYNRINQNGPAEMGWRTTAQNYNLNRDWIKADAPEMRAMLGLYNRWLPDLFIDTHTTDGADYQYDITYSLENFGNQHPAVVAWQREAFENHIFPALDEDGPQGRALHRAQQPDATRSKGFREGPAQSAFFHRLRARCTTARRCCWKRTCSRTTATASRPPMMCSRKPWRTSAKRPAACAARPNRRTAKPWRPGASYDAARRVPLTSNKGRATCRSSSWACACQRELSAVSGAMMDPATIRRSRSRSPCRSSTRCCWTGRSSRRWATSCRRPGRACYRRLALHGVKFTTLRQPLTREVETYHFDQVEWQNKPFENHHSIKELKFRPERRRLTFPAGFGGGVPRPARRPGRDGTCWSRTRRIR